MRSERQALADIAKLCDDEGVGPLSSHVVEKVRAILADVQPEPAAFWNRDAVLAEIEATVGFAVMSAEVEALADRILALVRPVEGSVVLTREERYTASRVLGVYAKAFPADEHLVDLAELLEAAS